MDSPYIPRMANYMGGDPWQAAANSYGSDLDRGIAMQAQGMQNMANAPLKLYQMFTQGYQDAQNRQMQQAQLERQNQMTDIAQQRADEQERRNAMLDRAKIADYLSKNLSGDQGSYEQAQAILGGSGYEGLLPKPKQGFDVQEATGELPGNGASIDPETASPSEWLAHIQGGGSGLPIEPGTATATTEYPTGTVVQEAKDKLAARAQEAKDKIQARFTAISMKAQAAKDLALDPNVPANQAKIAAAARSNAVADKINALLDAGDVEAAVQLKRAQAANAAASAGLASARTGLVDTQNENYGQVTEAQRFSEEQKNKRAADRAANVGAVAPPRPAGVAPSATTPQQKLEKAKAEFNALPIAQQTPENKAAIKQKYGLQ